MLALRQPAASDLRLIIAVSKAVSDLERIGDESAKIARMGLQLAEEGPQVRVQWGVAPLLSLIHISEPTRLLSIGVGRVGV